MNSSAIFSVKDTYGRTVTLTDGQWQHILSRHPEVQLGAIKKTVEQHQFIIKPDKYPCQEVYYRLNADANYPNSYCAVPTDFAETMAGTVVTAYCTGKPVKRGEVKHVNIRK